MSRTRHLIFLAHIWATLPFAIIWFANPKVAHSIPGESLERLRIFAGVVVVYVVVRTVLAFKDPAWLKWDFVYPLVDVLVVTCLMAFSDRDPVGHLALLYLFPIAEAAGTLSVGFAAFVGLLSIAGSAAVAAGADNSKNLPYDIAFRFFFLVLMASLLTTLAKQAAELRARLQVAADRNRLAMEMHDGVQGHLMSAASQMELIRHVVRDNPAKAAELAGEAQSAVRDATDEMRFMVRQLRSATLGAGFVPALKQYAHNLCERNGLSLSFEIEGEEIELAAEIQNALFRIAQEGLNNVLRHAEATQVEICLRFSQRGVKLSVEDNGVGCSALPDDGFHSGLDGMKERAAALSGSVSLSPGRSQGTVLTAAFPLKGVSRG